MQNNAKRKTASAPSNLQLALLAATAFLALVWLTFGMGWQHRSQQRVSFGSHAFWLEVADTPSAQTKGLGGRASLADNHGMLFAFKDSDVRCFWMKDTHIPLDMVWLDAEKEVQYIAADVQPNSYPATFCANNNPARYVIELSAGQTKKAGIHPGVTLRW